MKINGQVVKEIGNNAFKGKELTSIKMPDSVETIGMSAFAMNKLKSVEFSKNIKEIGNMAFYSNKLTSVIIPKNLTHIPTGIFGKNELSFIIIPHGIETIAMNAFVDNNLKSVTFSDSISTISNSAFKNNLLEDVTIPANITSIHGKAFDGNEKINLRYKKLIDAIKLAKDIDTSDKEKDKIIELNRAIDFAEDINNKTNASLGEVDHAVKKINDSIDKLENESEDKDEDKDEGIENGEWDVEDFKYDGTIITGFSDSGKEEFKTNKNVVLPSLNQDGKPITEIGDQAFLIADYETKQDPNIGINSVVLPNTIKTIGKEAFRYNSLTSINIPDSVTNIEMLAFNANNLKSLDIPNSVVKLGDGAFTMNEISSLVLPNTIKTIPKAFAFNKLNTLKIPEGVTRISDLAFSDNELTEISLPNSLEYLSGFNNNLLKTINIPNGVTELGFKAFASNEMTKVTIPGNVKIIGKRAFWNTWHDQFLNSVILEEGIEKIDEFAFRDNELKDVKIPSSLKELDNSAFGGNLGHNKVVHLYTPAFKNANNLSDSEGKHVINPAKVIVKYKLEDKILKEEEYFKIDGKYLHIGDRDVKITPNYSDNKYGLKDENVKSINLIDKDNVVVFEIVEKEIEEDVRIKSIGSVGSIAVDLGTSKNSAIDKLAKKTFIIDTNDKKHEVSLNWTVESYNENKSGEYQAVASFELPEGILQSEPETKLEVKSNIVIKENLEDSNWTKDDFIYEGTILKGLSEDGKEKIKTIKDLILPSENPKGQAITHIGASAFKELDIEKLIVPKQIREIGAFAFSENKISYVDFPGTIERVENQAFGKNNLVAMTFAEGEGTICLDSMSFLENKLTDITILKEVKKVHEDAFKNNLGHGDDNNKVHIYLSDFDPENNGLFENSAFHKIIELSVASIDPIETINVDYGTEKENIDLPNKINVKLNNGDIKNVDVDWISEDYDGQSAGEYIFKGSYDLPEINTGEKVDVTVKVIVKEKSEEKTDFEFSEGTITGYTGTDTDVKIPEMINGEDVSAIGNNAFNKKGLASVEIPSTVQTIGMGSFANNELTKVVLPTSLNSLGNMAFFNNKLTSLTINNGLEVISTAAFRKNELTDVQVPESVTSIARQAFMDNKLELVNIPTNINDIGVSSFENNNLSEVIIPKDIVTIGNKAFDGNTNINLEYTSLVEAIDIAEKIDTTGNTEETVKMLEEAIKLGKELNEKTNATLAEVTKMVDQINDAIETLDIDVIIESYAI